MRMKKNQERRLHRKNAKIAKEGGTPMTLNRPIKPDTTVSTHDSPLPFRSFPRLRTADRDRFIYIFNFRDAAATADRWVI
jgi:hypothetical protein